MSTEETLRAMSQQLGRIEASIAGIRQSRAEDREHDALMTTRIEKAETRLAVIEVHLARILGLAAGVSAAVSVVFAILKGIL